MNNRRTLARHVWPSCATRAKWLLMSRVFIKLLHVRAELRVQSRSQWKETGELNYLWILRRTLGQPFLLPDKYQVPAELAVCKIKPDQARPWTTFWCLTSWCDGKMDVFCSSQKWTDVKSRENRRSGQRHTCMQAHLQCSGSPHVYPSRTHSSFDYLGGFHWLTCMRSNNCRGNKFGLYDVCFGSSQWMQMAAPLLPPRGDRHVY